MMFRKAARLIISSLLTWNIALADTVQFTAETDPLDPITNRPRDLNANHLNHLPCDTCDNSMPVSHSMMTHTHKALNIVRMKAEGDYITSRASGNWSNASTWEGNRVPTKDDDVHIAHNVTIDNAVCRKLIIAGGTATLAGDIHAYGSIVVQDALLTGTSGKILFHVADDTQFTGNTTPGPDANMPDFHPEDIGLWVVMGGRIELNGPKVTPWLFVEPTGAETTLRPGLIRQQAVFSNSGGDGSARLSAIPENWVSGDRLLLADTNGNIATAVLETAGGTNITFHNLSIATFTAYGLIAGPNRERTIRPTIANLSRRIVIASADVTEGNTNHRAHTAFMHTTRAVVKYVEFRNLGPRRKLGRYPVHWHKSGNLTPGNHLLEGCSIHQDVTENGNRFVSIHATQNVALRNNVAFRSQGHGYFLEDRNEYDNEISGNLSVKVDSPEELNNVDQTIAPHTYHFWLRRDNKIENNVSIGGTGSGLTLLKTKKAGADPMDAKVLNFTGLGSTGNNSYGMGSTVANAHFINPVSAYNFNAAFQGTSPFGEDTRGIVIENPTFVQNGLPGSNYKSELFLSSINGLTVNGGMLIGFDAFHEHYTVFNINVNNVLIMSETALHPTYWECSIRFVNCDIRVNRMFRANYPIRGINIGLARIVNSKLQIGSAPVENNANYDFSGVLLKDYFVDGRVETSDGFRIAGQAPGTGFIRVPAIMSASNMWTVTPVGKPSTKPASVERSQAKWELTRPEMDGYSFGYPPGTYSIIFYHDNDLNKTSNELDVLGTGHATISQAGQVVDVTMDDATPRLLITSPQINQILSGQTANVRYIATGDVAAAGGTQVVLQMDDQPLVLGLPLQGTKSFTNLAYGNHTVQGYLAKSNGEKLPNTDIRVEFSNTDNQLPTARSASYSIKVNTVLNGQLVAEDPNNDSLSFAIASNPTKGEVRIDSNTGGFDYTPNPNFIGTDTFRFKASDGKSDSNTATITITVGTTTGPQPTNNLTINAGQDRTVSMGDEVSMTASVRLNNQAINNDQLVANWVWATGPAAPTFSDADSLTTNVTFPAPGTYVLRMVASLGTLINFDEVTITVSGATADQPVSIANNVISASNPELFLTINAEEAAHYEVDVRDNMNRTVEEIFNSQVPPGNFVVRWDGRKDGSKVASGAYSVLLRKDGRIFKKIKLVIVK